MTSDFAIDVEIDDARVIKLSLPSWVVVTYSGATHLGFQNLYHQLKQWFSLAAIKKSLIL